MAGFARREPRSWKMTLNKSTSVEKFNTGGRLVDDIEAEATIGGGGRVWDPPLQRSTAHTRPQWVFYTPLHATRRERVYIFSTTVTEARVVSQSMRSEQPPPDFS